MTIFAGARFALAQDCYRSGFTAILSQSQSTLRFRAKMSQDCYRLSGFTAILSQIGVTCVFNIKYLKIVTDDLDLQQY